MIHLVGLGMGPRRLSGRDWSPYSAVVCDESIEADIAHPQIRRVPLGKVVEEVLGLDGEVAYAVSGSPLFFSHAMQVARECRARSLPYVIHPAPSCKELLLARLGIPEEEVISLSLHGRKRLSLQDFLRLRYTLVLCDARSIPALVALLAPLHPEDYALTLGSRLGWDEERLLSLSLVELEREEGESLVPFVVLVERKFEPTPPPTALEELEFERGMVTSVAKRSVILGALELGSGMTLWDVGAGSGSVAIDAYKAQGVQTVLFEKNPLRCAQLVSNLKAHRVAGARVREGEVPETLKEETEEADRIFVGGGGVRLMVQIESLLARLRQGGILVAVFVSLDHLATLIERLNTMGVAYEADSLSYSSFEGAAHMNRSARELFIVKVRR